MITAIEIDDVAVATNIVDATITILHGRKKVTDPPTASSATVVIYNASPNLERWASGNTLRLISETGETMFLGRIAERELEHENRAALNQTPLGIITLTAMGAVAVLGYRPAGDDDWPEESGTERAEHILTAAGVPYLIDGDVDALILAREADSKPAMELLTNLGKSTGAAIVDLPDGTVMYQTMADRKLDIQPFKWDDFDPAFTWDDFDPAFTWDDFGNSPSSSEALDLPTNAIEWAPVWTTSTDVINHVRVSYGPKPETGEQAFTELHDITSQGLYGVRYQNYATDLADLEGAQNHATWILAVRSMPHWRFSDVVVHLGFLDNDVRLKVLSLVCGDHVKIDQMPQPSPAIVGEALVEGWTYNMWGENGNLFEQITLNLSSALESMMLMTWADYPDSYTWDSHPADLQWAQIYETSDLGV